MEILKDIAIIIFPLLIGYFLGRNRDNSKIIFDKKLEIYSNIVYYINSSKDLRISLDVSIEKLKRSTKEFNNKKENIPTSTCDFFYKKLKNIENNISWLNYKDELIKL